MSRNVYMVAAITPEFRSRIESEARSSGPHTGIVDLEAQIEAALDKPDLAYFAHVFDGWDRTHDVLSRFLEDGDSWSGVFHRLDGHGYAFVSNAQCIVPVSLREPEWDGLGDYAVAQLAGSIETACRFVNATDCDLVLTWRCIGPSFGDDEFRRSRDEA